ncbi:MAG: AAA family ATPase [Deltaproteobacteria bacterium]|nr:AAA family ATPase [Deltaproteobacteria bacterium]
MHEKRLSTGIQQLDLLIEGGFHAGKTYLVVGEPGTGKTIFGLQFLYKGLKSGEKALYVAVDQKPTDVIEQAVSLGWDLSPFIEKKDFLLLDASAYIKSRVGSSEMKSDMQKVILELNNHITQTGARRVVIDPLGPLIATDDSNSRVQDQARMLLYSLQGQGKTTTLITSHSVGRSARGIEEYLVAGTIVLEMELANNRFVRILTVEKMRSTAFNPAQYLFNIVPVQGIVLQPMVD